tara:strand:+ start:305 stop:724 length:420 start_codon:yes stop_codon:yes gene_type:complete
MARPYLGGSTGGVKALTASATLQKADSGKVITFTPPSSAGALVVTLPACDKGIELKIIQISDYDTAACKVLSAEGNNFVGHLQAQTGAGDNAGANVDYIEFGSATLAGDYVSLVSDGSKWYVVDSCMKITSNGMAFRSS